MGLKKFNGRIDNQSRKKKFVLIAGIILVLITIMIIQSYALYKNENKNNILEGSVGSFGHDVELAVYINDELSNRIPSKTDGYKVDEIKCNKGAEGKWNLKTWDITISKISEPTECSIWFVDKIALNTETDFTYTGSWERKNYDNDTKWYIRFLTSGTFISTKEIEIDAYLVGGGGGGAGSWSNGGFVTSGNWYRYSGGAGGSGTTMNIFGIQIHANETYSITIGSGGTGGIGFTGTTTAGNCKASSGNSSSAFEFSVSGGNGGGGVGTGMYCHNAGVGGISGTSGLYHYLASSVEIGPSIGSNQVALGFSQPFNGDSNLFSEMIQVTAASAGTITRTAVSNVEAKSANTGAGGNGASVAYEPPTSIAKGGNGGSGIIIIRGEY